MIKILSNVKRTFPLVTQVRNSKCCKPCPEYNCPRKPKEEEEYILYKHPILEKPKKHSNLYRNVFFFVCVPLIIAQYLNVYYLSPEDNSRPIFKPYEHLRIRRKKVPFSEDGVKSILHNSRYNALPNGYEYEVPPEEEFDPEDRFKNDPYR